MPRVQLPHVSPVARLAFPRPSFLPSFLPPFPLLPFLYSGPPLSAPYDFQFYLTSFANIFSQTHLRLLLFTTHKLLKGNQSSCRSFCCLYILAPIGVLERIPYAMASTLRSMLNVAVVGVAVVSTMAVSVNAQAAGPAPSPQSGAAPPSLMPTILAPVLVSLLAFLASRIM